MTRARIRLRAKGRCYVSGDTFPDKKQANSSQNLDMTTAAIKWPEENIKLDKLSVSPKVVTDAKQKLERLSASMGMIYSSEVHRSEPAAFQLGSSSDVSEIFNISTFRSTGTQMHERIRTVMPGITENRQINVSCAVSGSLMCESESGNNDNLVDSHSSNRIPDIFDRKLCSAIDVQPLKPLRRVSASSNESDTSTVKLEAF